MTRALLIKLSVILNTLYACEKVQDSEINHKINSHQKSFHSNNVIGTINVPKEINVKGKGDLKNPVFVDSNIPHEHKMQRYFTEGLQDQPLDTG